MLARIVNYILIKIFSYSFISEWVHTVLQKWKFCKRCNVRVIFRSNIFLFWILLHAINLFVLYMIDKIFCYATEKKKTTLFNLHCYGNSYFSSQNNTVIQLNANLFRKSKFLLILAIEQFCFYIEVSLPIILTLRMSFFCHVSCPIWFLFSDFYFQL